MLIASVWIVDRLHVDCRSTPPTFLIFNIRISHTFPSEKLLLARQYGTNELNVTGVTAKIYMKNDSTPATNFVRRYVVGIFVRGEICLPVTPAARVNNTVNKVLAFWNIHLMYVMFICFCENLTVEENEKGNLNMFVITEIRAEFLRNWLLSKNR